MFKNAFKFRADIPELGKYTVSEDFASIMIDTVMKNKPRIIIEAGSGISTIFLAYCLEKLGGGQLISFEHLGNYATQTREMLYQHNLTKVNVKVIHAPLCNYEYNNVNYSWYDIKNFVMPHPIDMLIVDGPPRMSGHLARYPILPLLYNKLSPHVSILLDDANRADEKEIVKKWLNEFPQFKIKNFATEKGAVNLCVAHDKE